jgi:hypothetical protein
MNSDHDDEDNLPKDINPNSEEMDCDESPLDPEQGTVDLNLDKGLQNIYNRVVDEAVNLNDGGIPGFPEQEDMSGMVEVEQVEMARRSDHSVDTVVPTAVQNLKNVVEEPVVDMRELSADDTVSFLLSKCEIFNDSSKFIRIMRQNRKTTQKALWQPKQ